VKQKESAAAMALFFAGEQRMNESVINQGNGKE
jgi:hypothetical protein